MSETTSEIMVAGDEKSAAEEQFDGTSHDNISSDIGETVWSSTLASEENLPVDEKLDDTNHDTADTIEKVVTQESSFAPEEVEETFNALPHGLQVLTISTEVLIPWVQHIAALRPRRGRSTAIERWLSGTQEPTTTGIKAKTPSLCYSDTSLEGRFRPDETIVPIAISESELLKGHVPDDGTNLDYGRTHPIESPAMVRRRERK
jgi:hypothetical protein